MNKFINFIVDRIPAILYAAILIFIGAAVWWLTQEGTALFFLAMIGILIIIFGVD